MSNHRSTTSAVPVEAAQVPSPAAPPREVREQMDRVLASSLFQTSQRYSNLLKFIVDRTLKGQNRDLKERIIGIEVFGRAPDYDTSVDPTVRVAVNEVRKRLAQYYSNVEHQQEIRIEIPVGSYLAEFRLAQPEPAGGQGDDSVKPRAHRTLRQWYIWSPLVLLIALMVAWSSYRILLPKSAIDRLWAPILKSSGPVLICIGSPLDTGATVPGSASTASADSGDLSASDSELVKVGMMDTSAAADLAAFLRQKGKEPEVRPTQGAKLSETRAEAVVLYGRYLNEWASQAGTDLHFRFHTDGKLGLRWIEDEKNPGNKQWSIPYPADDTKTDHDYAVITRVQDQTTGRWWVGIAGLTGRGTLAANRVVIDPKAMSTIAGSLPKGWDQKNVQILLEVKLLQGNAGAARMIASSIW